MTMPPTALRRVSFSNRVSYSDDASTSTDATTDDDVSEDDGLLSSSDDDSDDDSSMDGDAANMTDSEGGEEAGPPEGKGDDEEAARDDDIVKVKKHVDSEPDNPRDSKQDKSRMAGRTLKDRGNDDKKENQQKQAPVVEEFYIPPVKDEPPLAFRDSGVTWRPTEYLGGNGPEESCAARRKTVKFRKSWVATTGTNEEEDQSSDYKEFEAWKAARAKEAAEKKLKAKATSAEEKKDAADEMEPLPQETDWNAKETLVSDEPDQVSHSESEPTEKTDAPVKPANEPAKKTLDDLKHVSYSKSKPASETNTNAPTKPTNVPGAKPSGSTDTSFGAGKEPKTLKKEATKPAKERKSASKKKKAKKEKARKGSKVDSQVGKPTLPAKRVIKPTPKDHEMAAHEKEVLELKGHIAKLQRKLDTIEVRTISQLADLEEESTRRMREYRAKADEIVRKQKAKNEKEALKMKAMKSQDLIEHFRKSNQKLRADGVKIAAAVAKLREDNQSLAEKRSVHHGYAAEFLAFQKVEVGLAEAMNESLKSDIPKYERLIRSMEDGVVDRVKSAQVERNAKELYEDCYMSMVEMLEANSSDATLMDKIESLLEEEPDKDASDDKPTLSSSVRGGSMDPKVDASTASTRRTGTTAAMVSPTKSSVRRSSSSCGGNGKKSKSVSKQREEIAERRRSASRDSLRSKRASGRSSLKPVSDTDDSSACSFTCSVTSATSENFSITDYAY